MEEKSNTVSCHHSLAEVFFFSVDQLEERCRVKLTVC